MADNFSGLFSQLAPFLQSGQGQQTMKNLMSMIEGISSTNAPLSTYEPSNASKSEPLVPPFGKDMPKTLNQSPFGPHFPDINTNLQSNASLSMPASQTSGQSPMDGMVERILHFKNIYDRVMNESDSRINLLVALKPYMGQTRLQKLDQAVWMMKLTKLSKHLLPSLKGGTSDV